MLADATELATGLTEHEKASRVVLYGSTGGESSGKVRNVRRSRAAQRAFLLSCCPAWARPRSLSGLPKGPSITCSKEVSSGLNVLKNHGSYLGNHSQSHPCRCIRREVQGTQDSRLRAVSEHGLHGRQLQQILEMHIDWSAACGQK